MTYPEGELNDLSWGEVNDLFWGRSMTYHPDQTTSPQPDHHPKTEPPPTQLGQTGASENITFAHFTTRVVKMLRDYIETTKEGRTIE